MNNFERKSSFFRFILISFDSVQFFYISFSFCNLKDETQALVDWNQAWEQEPKREQKKLKNSKLNSSSRLNFQALTEIKNCQIWSKNMLCKFQKFTRNPESIPQPFFQKVKRSTRLPCKVVTSSNLFPLSSLISVELSFHAPLPSKG